MTSSAPSAPTVADLLRGDPQDRPPRDHTSAEQLRRRLEEHFAPRGGEALPPRSLRAASFRAPFPTLQSSVVGRFRGILVNVALGLYVSGFHSTDAFADAVSAWRASAPMAEQQRAFASLDADQLARLAADVRAHTAVLLERLGTISASWRPRTNVRTALSLANGRLVLRDEFDLLVGTEARACASIALLDVTTAPLSEDNEAVMQYHALTQTLRSGVVPLRTALLSTATGEIWSRTVSRELLEGAVAAIEALPLVTEAA